MNENFETKTPENTQNATAEAPAIDPATSSSKNPESTKKIADEGSTETAATKTEISNRDEVANSDDSEANSEQTADGEENPFQNLINDLESSNKNFQKKLSELREWGESQNIPEKLNLKNLSNQEKLDQIFDAVIESELKADGGDNDEKSDQKRKDTKGKLMDILAKGVNNLDKWLVEGTQVTFNDGMLRMIEAVFGNYYGSPGSTEKSSGKEAGDDLITAEGFFGQINSDPNEFANIIYNAYDRELKFSGWNPGSEALTKLTEARKSNSEEAKKILQEILTGVKSEDGDGFKVQTSLIKYLKEASDEVSTYRWQVTSKSIGEGLGAKGLNIEIKDTLDNIASQKTKADNYFQTA